MNPYRRVHARWTRFLTRHGYGLVGAGEPFDRRVSVRVAQSTRVLVERSVARTCFAVSYLLRESILRGLDPAFEDLRYRIGEARRQGLRHPPLAIFGPPLLAPSGPLRPAPYRPLVAAGDTPWSIGPRPVQLQTLVTRSLACAVTDCAVRLGVPDTVVIRHALALGWSDAPPCGRATPAVPMAPDRAESASQRPSLRISSREDSQSANSSCSVHVPS